MIEQGAFETGLRYLARLLGTKLTDERAEAYYTALRSEFSTQSWQATISRASVECERFPPPKTLLALRSHEASTQRHSCDLCRDRSGWVEAKRIETKGGLGGKLRGGTPLSYQPCPNRMDARASAWYADRADKHLRGVEEERESARSTARALSKHEARRLMGKLDPSHRLLRREE